MNQKQKQLLGAVPSSDVLEKFSFMYRKCAMHPAPLTCWLAVPEFVSELEKLNSKKISITNETILPIMQEVYPIVKDSESMNRNWKSSLKSGINQVLRAVNPN